MPDAEPGAAPARPHHCPRGPRGQADHGSRVGHSLTHNAVCTSVTRCGGAVTPHTGRERGPRGVRPGPQSATRSYWRPGGRVHPHASHRKGSVTGRLPAKGQRARQGLGRTCSCLCPHAAGQTHWTGTTPEDSARRRGLGLCSVGCPSHLACTCLLHAWKSLECRFSIHTKERTPCQRRDSPSSQNNGVPRPRRSPGDRCPQSCVWPNTLQTLVTHACQASDGSFTRSFCWTRCFLVACVSEYPLSQKSRSDFCLPSAHT